MVHRRLALDGRAFVRHTAPATRFVAGGERPQLTFAAGGPPDYSGTLAGGRSVIFELKSTEAERFAWTKGGRGRRELTRIRQLHDLEEHGRLGALTGLLVAFTGGMKHGQRIEFVWVDWSRASLLTRGTWNATALQAAPVGGGLVLWARGDPDWIEAALVAEEARDAVPAK